MDRRTTHTILREKYNKILRSIEINNDQSEIQSTIIDIRREISNFNSQLRDLPSAHRKLTQTTVIILTRILIKIENHQRRGAGARSNAVGSQSIQSQRPRIQWVEQENVFNNRMSTAAIININHKDVTTFLDDAKGLLIQKVNSHLHEKNSLKINTVLAANFEMIKDDVIQTVTKYFSDGSITILQSTDLDSQFSENFEILKTDLENMEDKGSGWTLKEIIHLEVQINEYIPLQGGNSSYIDLPQWIINTRSVVNIQNLDNMCFVWSVLAGLYNVKEHANRVSTY
ncbi:uncharacterized protein LOC122857552 [Aphidius gifuensis]|uniref:uncharacterized protein LOC122857552 n=1 Tax=Aphidius gifuensis TaxID=684658 RepID=UPI001CDCE531|nr:uncharacterized protein LOC122857552 [Aphidius gifuensis]